MKMRLEFTFLPIGSVAVNCLAYLQVLLMPKVARERERERERERSLFSFSLSAVRELFFLLT